MPLTGQNILLREQRREDLPFLLSLRNDMLTQGWSQALPPDYTEHMYLQRYEKREFSFHREEGLFVIEEIESGDPVGTISYSGLEHRLSATIGIAISTDFWGSGYALEAQELLLEFMFQELGLQVIRLFTQSGNPRAIALAEKSGFTIAARLREAIIRKGQLFDNIIMDLTREEYFERHPELENRLPLRGAGTEGSKE